MTPGVYFHPSAEQELIEASSFYDREREGLGGEFLNEVIESLEFIARFPQVAPIVRGAHRSLVISRFPFSLVYRPLRAGRVRILAVAHHKRRPDYWSDRKVSVRDQLPNFESGQPIAAANDQM